ncbi:nuclear pore complex protein Nup155-like [Hydractinia symbiolongicarpus]|uniref:nuclear pore complex protein Nup155-like n=1 Tax=Hydractinia symbiolongicarpus TaxID=13093 RepID=UPI00254A0491|nr:nuclear pore complex protein Nup155-like [Hydractinia symbiolongicarpus]
MEVLPGKQFVPEMLTMSLKEVDQQMLNDSKSPLLEEQLSCNVYPTLSGMKDFDYPLIPIFTDNASTTSTYEKQLTSIKRVPLPDELVEQFSHMQCNCVMGVFPEISRAWLAIDSDIYFWIYEDGTDVAYYDGIKEVILAAGLIQPKEGVFHDHIKYLLCVTTPVTIYLFGISFSPKDPIMCGNSHGSIQLHPEALFTVPTDNIYMTSVCGTNNGRIFLAGKDSCLHEIVYKTQSSWFGKQCYRVNHTASKMSFLVPAFLSYVFSSDDPVCQLAIDNSRGTLFCRTEAGDIKVYYLGQNMEHMNFVAGLNMSSITKQAQYVVRTVDSRYFEKIVHVAPVPRTDSAYIHAVAITQAGVRLYFTTTNINDPHGEPSCLKLVHVRMPTGFAPSIAYEKPSNVHTGFYRKGTSLLIANVSEGLDRMWCFGQDLFPFKSPLKESQSVARIDGHTWCLTEIPDFSDTSGVPYYLFNEEFPDPPAVVTEHVLPIRRFVLLSAQGSHIITTLRPLDQLRMLLHASCSGESDTIESFFKHYGVDQACAICLILICQCVESEGQLIDLATQAFFRYGGETSETSGYLGRTTVSANNFNAIPNTICSPIQGGSSEGSYLSTPHGYHPQSIQTPAPPSILNSTVIQPGAGTEQVSSHSGKHNGLYLYFSRILRPVWNFPMIHLVAMEPKPQQFSSRLSASELSWFIELLTKLKNFIGSHSHIVAAQSPTYIHTFVNSSSTDVQCANEKRSLDAFHQLLTLSIEALELWRILCEHNISTLYEALPMDVKEKLLHTAFKDLFAPTGRELSSNLINAVMSMYLHDNSAVESISSKLRSVCPSLYSANDALCSKANELLIGISLLHNPVEKEKLAQEAIMIYSKVPDLVDLKWICNQLKSSSCYNEIVQLCLTTALKQDPKGIALHFYKSGEPRDDIEGMESFAIRRESYMYIMDTLQELLASINTYPISSSLPSKPGPPAPSENLISQETARKHFHGMLSQCLKSGDELFHVTLYQWFIRTNQTDRLLEIKSPFLEQYLIATAAEQHPNNKEVLDLLWKFYEKNKNFMSAAKLLMKLSEKEGPTLTIQNRLEYLSRALISAKSAPVNTDIDGEFLQEVEEKLEVAQIQLKIFDQLSQKNIQANTKDKALIELNLKLLDISTLYGDFAEVYSLHECKLAIVQCAGHSDVTLVEKIWQDIIETSFNECKSLSPASKMQTISQQIIHLGNTYVQHPRYFPINFLLLYLEKKSCEMHFNEPWVFTMLQQIGVSFPVLLQNYVALHQSREKIWQRLGKPLHMFHVISCLFVNFLENITEYRAESLSLTRSIDERTTTFLVELETMNTSDLEVKNLLTRFKGVQARLKRML